MPDFCKSFCLIKVLSVLYYKLFSIKRELTATLNSNLGRAFLMKIASWWNNQTFLQKFFVLFLLFSGVMWVLVPTVNYSTLSYDPPETLMWGSTFNWGNAKHPPLAGWMLFNFCRLFGFPNFSIFILSQICVTIGFIYIYKLSRCFFDRDISVISTLLITFHIFYNYATPGFNANIPHLLFLPMLIYYFYRGCSANKWHHWLLAAAAAACACLSKYSAGVVGLTLVLFLFADKNARRVLLTVKPYAAALFFFLLMLPHFLHLINTDFLVFNYIQNGKAPKYSYFVQILFIAGAIMLPFLSMTAASLIMRFSGNPKLPWGKLKVAAPEACRYSGFIMWGQAAFLLLMGICGHRLRSAWTFPLYLTAGIFIISFFSNEINSRSKRTFAWLCSVFAVILMLFSAGYHNFKSKFRYHIDKEELRKVAENFYREKTGREIPFITGDVWHASSLQNAFKYKMKAAPDSDPLLLRLHWDTIRRYGALVITDGAQTSSERLSKYVKGQLQWQKMQIKYAARFGKAKKHTFYLAAIPPGALIKGDCINFSGRSYSTVSVTGTEVIK